MKSTGPEARGADEAPRHGDGKDLLRWSREVVAAVGAYETEMRGLADNDFPALTEALRIRLAAAETLDSLLPEAFAAAREAALRTLGQRPYDVQIMGGAVLHAGRVTEMLTGEGKTLTATLPAYLNALAGDGVHVMTSNDYLARRDAKWMGPVYRFLGLNIGLIGATMSDTAKRQQAYRADVTYGHHMEFAYDYLRDGMLLRPGDVIQRRRHLAIVDEADLILVDEARATAIVSTTVEQSTRWVAEFAKIAARLQPSLHYLADQQRKSLTITDDGALEVEDLLGVPSLYEADEPLVHYLQNALKAREFYRKDDDYIIEDGQVAILDPTSGRPQRGTRWDDGIHEAIEAKEGLKVHSESRLLARVPMWDYLRQYRRLSAMTGSATTEAETYRRVYSLDVVTIPTNRPMIRVDHPDKMYASVDAKLKAIAAEVKTRNATGQPVLIGAMSVEQAETISGLLERRGVSHELLSAKNLEDEAAIIAKAGRLGAVTVVAKMAGRGVDIVLGGGDPAECDVVAHRGGLCVLGTERTRERRVELLLRGRAGRQGDPGESLFFVSFEDELGKGLVRGLFGAANRRLIPDGSQLGPAARMIDRAQAQVAAQNAATLATILEYDQVLADQQHQVYAERLQVFDGAALRKRIQSMLGDVIRSKVAAATSHGAVTEQFWREIPELYPVQVTPEALAAQRGCDVSQLPPGYVADQVIADARQAFARKEAELGKAGIAERVRQGRLDRSSAYLHQSYAQREADIGAELMRTSERRMTLAAFDVAWREQLVAMQDLLQAIEARSAGGAPSLPEYRREAGILYSAMRDKVREDIIRALFRLQPVWRHGYAAR